MITLPVPPSTNNLFANGKNGGRFKTREYKDWLKEAGLRLNLQRPDPIFGPYILEIRVPKKLGGDISNRIKAPEDLLVAHGVTPDDRKAHRISIERADVTEMQIDVRPVSGHLPIPATVKAA